MGSALIATSALALAAGPASAADMMSVGVGGYMQNWFGYADRDDEGADGGFAVHQDSEIHFKGSLESDSGLKFSVHVELEGDESASTIDESFARVSGEFGQIEFGGRDHAMVRMHAGVKDVGVGLNAGDTQAWIPGTYLETSGHAGTAGGGNDPKINYISPRVAGLQVGVSYAPEDGAKRTTTPSGNDAASWGAGINFKQDVGDMAVTFSLGRRSVASGATQDFSILTDSTAKPGMTKVDYKAHMAVWDLWENQPTTAAEVNLDHPTAMDDADTSDVDESKIVNLEQLQVAARASKMALEGRPMMMVSKSTDDASYTNAGLGVSVGAFTFNVAYATADMPTSYMLKEMDGVVVDSSHMWDHDGDNCMTPAEDPRSCTTPNNDAEGSALTEALPEGQTEYTANVMETAENDDPSNDKAMTSMVTEGASADYDVWGVSVTYSDGPMAVSLAHMTHEEDAGGERTATMFSASYSLAPGVAWKSSIFTVDDTTSKAPNGESEGTGFVTGITLGF